MRYMRRADKQIGDMLAEMADAGSSFKISIQQEMELNYVCCASVCRV